MPIRQVITCFFMTVLFFACLNSQVSAQEVDGPVAREHLKRQTLSLLYREKFAELEEMAARLRVDRATFPDGAFKEIISGGWRPCRGFPSKKEGAAA